MSLGFAAGLDFMVESPLRDEVDVLVLEEPMLPGFLDERAGMAREIKRFVLAVGCPVLAMGPYIDLNPGSPEPLCQAITRQRVLECLTFAAEVGIHEVVFLSTWLPQIGVPFYDEGWLSASMTFWRACLDEVRQGPAVLFCNTFDPDPEMMKKLISGVGSPRFRPALDVGHALAYGRVGWDEWASLKPRLVLVHSNEGKSDAHLSPRLGKLPEEEGVWELLRRCERTGIRIAVQGFDRTSLAEDLECVRRRLG